MNNVGIRGRLIWESFIRVPATRDEIDEYKLFPEDVLFNNTNSIELVGKSALFTGHQETIVYSNHFTRLRVAKEQLDPFFLATWLLHQWQSGVFENLCNRWIGQSAVKNEMLLGTNIPLPSLDEQRRIAGMLNARLAIVEKARAAAEAQLDAVNALPATLMRRAFNGEL
jgi:type I restriction enzyme S subunit